MAEDSRPMQLARRPAVGTGDAHATTQPKGGNVPRTAMDMVSEAADKIENLDPEQLAAELAEGDLVLVDVRGQEDRMEAGAIAGALHSDRGFIEFRADPTSPYHFTEFEPGARTILYCGGGGQSALAGATLVELGYTDVAHLEGGLAAWVEAGHEVEAVEE